MKTAGRKTASAAAAGKGAAKSAISKKTAASESSAPRDLARAAGAVFAALALLRLLAAQFPAARVWGLNTPAWLPVWLQFAVTAVGLLAATPLLYRLFRFKGELIDAMPTGVLAPLLAVAAGALFWFLRMETYFLGDGAVYLAEHFRFVRGLSVSENVLYSIGSAPLTAWLLAQGAAALWSAESMLAGNAQFVFWIAGALSGAAFVAMITVFSRRWSEDGTERLAFIAILLSTPAVLFFFGYVEYYTFTFVCITATVFLSIEAARGRVASGWPVLMLLVSAAFHHLSLLLLPGVALALLSRRDPDGRILRLRTVVGMAIAALIVGGVYYFASGISHGGSRIVLSLAPFGAEGAVQRYTLFSGAHLMDALNMLLLAGAPLLAVLPFLRGRGWDPAALVGLTHAIFAFFLMFFGYTGFGMARDWDVNAFFAVVLAMLVLTLLRREEARRRKYLLYLAACGSLAAVLPWLLVNLDSGRSERRFRDLMSLDDRLIPGDFALNGYEHLRKYYQSTGDRTNVAWAIQKKIEMVGYPEDFRKYALAVLEGASPAERPDRYAWMFAQLRDRLHEMDASGVDSLYEGSRAEFCELYVEFLIQLGQLPQSASEIDVLFRGESAALAALGGSASAVGTADRAESRAAVAALLEMAEGQYMWGRTGVFPGAGAYRSAAGKIETSGTLAFHAGRGLLTAGEQLPAIAALEQALALDSNFTLPAYYLAEAETRLAPPRVDHALEHYALFLSTPERHRIADPSTQQQLMDDARMKSGELELLRSSIP
jgi:hypothetical protein